MGKYMKKAKPSGEVAAMESTVGVRTRARTLALLQTKHQEHSSYLELRSRRLEKPPSASTPKSKPNLNPRNDKAKKKNGLEGERHRDEEEEEEEDEGVAVSFFGENVLDAEPTERTYRETTPCTMIRDPETMGTPGSTTRPTGSIAANRRRQSSMHQNIPTSHDIEEFFAGAERLQQRTFMEKYNFDPVNDCPLPGRYEWLILDQ
ncbi:cyclin-dependent kinase inhibitor 4-like [Iris pallida]|uniref:Cyclin-dependent kinase inhibitor n=1 Tax=Iris pallida TaxID=29817 RepID=A0AAX6FZP4_IRIPA|nr:cyclin-dependent kinase inhibitor 4-like [Iris pallida]